MLVTEKLNLHAIQYLCRSSKEKNKKDGVLKLESQICSVPSTKNSGTTKKTCVCVLILLLQHNPKIWTFYYKKIKRTLNAV
jgi:hypothetical protein